MLKGDYDSRWFHDKKILSIGKTTTKELKDSFLVPDIQVEEETSTGIVNWYKENATGKNKILIPRSDNSSKFLLNELSKLGHEINIIQVYHSAIPKNIVKQDLNDIDSVVFTSPTTVNNFLLVYNTIPEHVKLISRGEQTRTRLEECGFKATAMNNHIFQAAKEWKDENNNYTNDFII